MKKRAFDVHSNAAMEFVVEEFVFGGGKRCGVCLFLFRRSNNVARCDHSSLFESMVRSRVGYICFPLTNLDVVQ